MPQNVAIEEDNPSPNHKKTQKNLNTATLTEKLKSYDSCNAMMKKKNAQFLRTKKPDNGLITTSTTQR